MIERKYVVKVKKEDGDLVYIAKDGRLTRSANDAQKYTERSEATNHVRSIRNSEYLGSRRIYVDLL